MIVIGADQPKHDRLTPPLSLAIAGPAGLPARGRS
jgi:hypothetical protein